MARRRSATRGDGAGWAAVVMTLMAVAIAGMMVWLYQKARTAERYDSVSLCPVSGETGNLVILIDKTDPISLTQLSFGRNYISERIDEAEVGTRITIGIVSPDRQARKDAFLSLCKPPSNADELIENKSIVEERYRQDFKIRIDNLLKNLLSVSEESASPIVENLQELLSQIPDFIANEKPATLVILSNLAQHSDILSFYRGGTWQSFKDSGHISRLSKSLEGMEVYLFRIPLPAAFQPDLQNFWRRYLDAQGINRLYHVVVGDL